MLLDATTAAVVTAGTLENDSTLYIYGGVAVLSFAVLTGVSHREPSVLFARWSRDSILLYLGAVISFFVGILKVMRVAYPIWQQGPTGLQNK
jgi:hypothetical protein